MTRRVLSAVLSLALVVAAVPTMSAAGSAVGQISGVALSPSGGSVGGQLARLRSLDAGSIAGQTMTSAAGEFSFSGVANGSYIVEVVSDGYIAGTSAPVVVTDRDTVIDSVPVTIGAKSPEFLSFLGMGGFWGTTGGFLVSSAIVGGIVTTAIVVAKKNASGSE